MAVWPDLVYAESASLCAAIAAVTDLRSRRIPNWLTGSGVLAGISLHLFLGGLHECCFALLAGLIAGSIFLVMFIAGGMGAGDVKLMAAVGTLGGIHALHSVLIAIVILGAVAAVVMAAVTGRLRETVTNVRTLMEHHQANGLKNHPDLHVENHSMLRLPYAVPIAGGCIVAMMMRLYGGHIL